MVTLIRELLIKQKSNLITYKVIVRYRTAKIVVTVCKCEGKGAGAYSHSLQVALSAVFAP